LTGSKNISDRYKFSVGYISNYDDFRNKIFNKTIIPYQVEFQPPPKSIRKICWLDCPYCYGASADDGAGDRMLRETAIKTLNEVADGGVKKVIFAGYATDPLNSPYLEDLLEIAINRGLVFGFNTKAIKISNRLLDLLSRKDIKPNSYMSLSVDAGSNEIYNTFHDVKSKAKIYDRVLNNTKKIIESCQKGNFLFDVSAAYLVNSQNWMDSEVSKFIKDFKGAGCDLLRFTFPQPPRETPLAKGIIPNTADISSALDRLTPIIHKSSTDDCNVIIVDADSEHDIFYKPRTKPCFARWIYPTVGYDGWLYHCSQSASPNFRPMALGNLNKSGFWELFYNYNVEEFDKYMTSCGKKMDATSCRCDRKMHVTNQSVIDSNAFVKDLNQVNDLLALKNI
jgi:MoaA/NifB/PqqE/SkfB family radical SAM enzyme